MWQIVLIGVLSVVLIGLILYIVLMCRECTECKECKECPTTAPPLLFDVGQLVKCRNDWKQGSMFSKSGMSGYYRYDGTNQISEYRSDGQILKSYYPDLPETMDKTDWDRKNVKWIDDCSGYKKGRVIAYNLKPGDKIHCHTFESSKSVCPSLLLIPNTGQCNPTPPASVTCPPYRFEYVGNGNVKCLKNHDVDDAKFTPKPIDCFGLNPIPS